MSDESVDIKVNLTGVTSDVERKLKEFGDKAKKGIDVPISGKSQVSSQQQINRPLPSAKSKPPQRGFLDKSRSSTATGAQAAQQPQSDFDQLSRGGFYEAIQGKVDSLKNAKNVWDDWSKKKQSAKGHEGSVGGNSGSNGNQGAFAQGSGRTEFKEAIFKNVKVERAEITKALRGAPMGAMGQALNMGGGGGVGGSKSGDLAQGSGKALPFLGIGLMIAGAVAKAASSLGEAHIKAMMSQAGTIGATGGYVGGGGGYFANADVAQAHIARGRISGDSVFGKNRKAIDQQEMRFAAQQGRGLSEITEAMAKLKKESSQNLNFYRGAATQSGFKNLRQSEYFTKMADLSDSFRSQGFSGNMESFMSTVAGMQLGGANADPMRKISIAENFRNASAKGVFGGGVLGGLAFKEALDRNGGDTLKALIDSEGSDGAKLGMSGLLKNVKDPLALAVMGKMTGAFSATESQKLQLSDLDKTISPARDISKEEVGFNKVLSLDNKKNDVMANSQTAANIASTMQKAAELLLDVVPKIDKVFSAMENATNTILKGSAAGAEATMEFVKDLQSKDISTLLKEALTQIIPGGKIFNAIGALER
jgi:hypothetical protein